jgi:ribosomal protein L22
MRIVKLTEDTKKDILTNLLKRSPDNYGSYEETVKNIVNDIHSRRDTALFEYTEKFDHAKINADNVRVTEAEIEEAYTQVDAKLLETIRKAIVNIRTYHEKQKQYSWFDSENNGTLLGQKVTPLAKVGVYVPGGKAAYPSSVLMNVIPAKVAGVGKIVMTTPCNAEGKVYPTTLVAAKEAGVDEVYKAGGAQAIAILRDCPTSPRKMRLVADIIRGVEINKALGILRFSKKEASIRMEKLLKSAIANWEAKNEGERLEDTKLCVKEIFVDGGRMLKRIQPAPQGRAHRIRKRSNHVTIVVDKMVTVENK